MSAEFFVRFNNVGWYAENLNKIKEKVIKLKTFSKEREGGIWLVGDEPREEKYPWAYDVRLIFSHTQHILVEISAHPRSIESDLSLFFNWLRSLTAITIEDEDGVISNW